MWMKYEPKNTMNSNDIQLIGYEATKGVIYIGHICF
jgi:hypothetical protein